MQPAKAAPVLSEALPPGGSDDPDQILDLFLRWVTATGLVPYAHQEEALLELMADRHVVLDTPTGSGKSLVALALHFKAMCEGKRSFYTSPTKALASEKFFALCHEFGPERVGMLTGDASINSDAPIICCTTEVLANMALRQGAATDAPYVVMDEFHFYSDAERGASWQIPLLALRQSVFLLMSATLGDTEKIERSLREQTGREVAHVFSLERPVPLDYEYRETSMHETVEELLANDKGPLYIVHFTHRECAEQAQALTSANICDKPQRARIAEALVGTRFDTPYGKEFHRFLRHGIGVHHAGLLPKYRLLVEQLSQQALLRVICGTDTLGVGVNIPIRSVVFSKLSKFDGEKVGILSVRSFRQISGRAGRKGFDDRGSVLCQAPPHMIESKRGARPARRKKRPPRGMVAWNRQTFDALLRRPPERLSSRFEVTHGMIVHLLQRQSADEAGGYRALAELIEHSHESDRSKRRHRRAAAAHFRALRRAGIVEVARSAETGRRLARVVPGLQPDFSLHHTLSLYLYDAVAALDPESPDYALDVLSLVEAILENPRVILLQQADRMREELLAQLKREGVPYEERIRLLDEVEHPKPLADFIYETFNLFADAHPWVGQENIRPKSVAREMYERYTRFDEYVRSYGMARGEGVLLRYLSQVHNTLAQNVPESARTPDVYDALAYLRATLERVDSSLLEEWESLLAPDAAAASSASPGAEDERRFDLASSTRALAARVRAELHRLVHALADADYEEAARCVRQDPDDPWDAARLERELAPFLAEHERIVFDRRARLAEFTTLTKRGPRAFDAQQVLLDPDEENLWSLQASVDLDLASQDEPLLRLRRIGV